MKKKKLYRSTQDRILCGVIGGFAEYFDVDSTVLRLLTAVAILVTGFFPGAIFYLIACVIMPVDTEHPHIHEG